MQRHELEKEHLSPVKRIYHRQQPKQGTDWPKTYAGPQAMDLTSRVNIGGMMSLAAASCSLGQHSETPMRHPRSQQAIFTG